MHALSIQTGCVILQVQHLRMAPVGEGFECKFRSQGRQQSSSMVEPRCSALPADSSLMGYISFASILPRWSWDGMFGRCARSPAEHLEPATPTAASTKSFHHAQADRMHREALR